MTSPLTLPLVKRPAPDQLPDYLPVRMVNEFVYCPRLFFYEWVDGLFLESADTIEGAAQHARVDQEGGELAAPEDLDADLKTQAITLSSERFRIIAKVDLLTVAAGVVTPVDYKRGAPQAAGESGAIELWPADRVQVALQALILRENGYRCEEAIVYYRTTKQRVRLAITEAVLAEAIAAVDLAWATARLGVRPAPLMDSPKCIGCSLNPICLPDETNSLARLYPELAVPAATQLPLFDGLSRKGPSSEGAVAPVRRLLAPRDDLKPVYLDTQGLRVGKSGEVLQVKERAKGGAADKLLQEIRLHDINQLNLMGNIQVTTQAIQALCGAEIPVCYFSQSGWFYGITQGLVTKNVFLRQAQYRLAAESWFCLRLARQLVAAKIRNQRVLLMRNHVEPSRLVTDQMREMADRATEARSLEELLGIEGNGARLYFGSFAGMLKQDDGDPLATGDGRFTFDFTVRNRRPPRDPVNALLSLAYSMLAKDLMIACHAVGFDPMLGYYHQPRFGRAALALDLMEPFRPLIADSAVLSAINNRMVTPKDFLRAGKAVVLTPKGRKAFYQAYELRMDMLVTHPLFDYRLTYRRMLEVQARVLGRVLEGEIGEYPAFVTR